MIKKKMFIINKKIILKNLFLVADKILKMKDYPLYINQNCHRVTVSPYTETHLKKFQVKSSFFFHFKLPHCQKKNVYQKSGNRIRVYDEMKKFFLFILIIQVLSFIDSKLSELLNIVESFIVSHKVRVALHQEEFLKCVVFRHCERPKEQF